jgi:hypothetical protein
MPAPPIYRPLARRCPQEADNEISQPRSGMCCHSERSEESALAQSEILPLRFTQGFGSCAQDDRTDFDREKS